MFKPYALFIGLRYAGAKSRFLNESADGRNNILVSFISRVSVIGMVLSVALLITVLSVMSGFDREMRERILGLVPHILVTSYPVAADHHATPSIQEITDLIEQHGEVVATAPFTQVNGMLMRGDRIEAMTLFGIDPDKETAVSIIGNFIHQQALNALKDKNSIILGQALAERLKVKKGDRLNVMVPQENQQGRITPKYTRLNIVGLVDTGTELDQRTALVNFEQALQLMPIDQQSSGLRVSVTDIFQAPRIAWELNNNLPYGYTTTNWERSYKNLYAAIQLSKQLVGLMLVTIIAVAAFNVVSALIMIVTDKRGDIAILRTAGASPRGILAIFITQGTMIGLIGAVLGVVLGVALSLSITHLVVFVEQLFNIQLLNSDVYPIDYVPTDLRFMDVFWVAVTALLMSFVATIYPAWRAAKVQPADALRYE